MSSRPDEACPAPEQLEQAITSGTVPAEIAAHLAHCDACRAFELQIRENLSFMQGVLEELGDEAGKSGGLDLSTPPDPDALPGYSLLREVARGGQGTVYEGMQLATRRRVAVKVIDAGRRGARGRRRIEREAEIAAGLRHPNIVTVYHSTVMPDGRYALAMEYVDGTTLDLWAKEVDAGANAGKESYRDAVRTKLRAMVAVCDAVQYAHHNGVIHRDLKPANVLVGHDGTPRVVDFGIARRVSHAQAITKTGAFAGTLAYASPEQVSGNADAVDTRSDVYSLGLILYEILAMRRPYDTDGSLTGAIANITNSEPSPLSTIEPGSQPAGTELEAIVRKALAKDRERRYQTAGALKADLENFLDGRAVEARRESSIYMLRKAAAKHRVPFAIGAGFVTILTAFAISTAWSSRQLARQGRMLAENLSASNIERGRLLSLSGEQARAEALIWPELVRAGGVADDSSPGFRSSPAVTQAAWALRELYSRHPSLLHVTVRANPGGVVFEPDGKNFRVLYGDGVQEVRSRTDGSLVRTIEGIGLTNRSTIDVATVERRAIIASPSGFVTLDMDAGKQERFNDPAICGVPRADVSPDGARLLVVGSDESLSLWQTGPLVRTRILAPKLSMFGQGRFSSDGTLAVGGINEEIRMWRGDDGELMGRWKIPPAIWSSSVRPGVGSVRISPDNSELAMAFTNSILFFDAKDEQRPPQQVTAHRGFVVTLRYSENGKYLMSSGQEDVVRVWDAKSKSLLSSIEAGVHIVGSPGFTPDGSEAVLCDGASGVRIFQTTPTSWRTVLEGHENTVNRVAFSPDDSLLASVGADGTLRTWKVSDHSLAWKTPALPQSLNALAFTPDGATIAMIAEDGSVSMRLTADGSPTGPKFAAPARPTWIGFTPDASMLAVACSQPSLPFYDAKTGQLRFTLAGHSRRVAEAAFSPDGKTVVSVAIDGTGIIWDLPSRTERCRLQHGPSQVRAVAISADGKIVATGADDRKIRLWDLQTGELLRTFSEAKHNVFGLAFHPSGNLLFSCCRDPVVQVWDVRTGKEVAALTGQQDTVPAIALSADGTRLAAGCGDRTIGMWDLLHYDRNIRGNAPAWTK